MKGRNLIDYDKIIDSPYLLDSYYNGFDSLFYSIESDTLFVSNAFFMKGRTGREEFAYIKVLEDVMYLKTPLLDSGMVEVIDDDTIIHSIIGCDCAGSVEQRFKIPLSKLKNIEHLYFKGQEIEFE